MLGREKKINSIKTNDITRRNKSEGISKKKKKKKKRKLKRYRDRDKQICAMLMRSGKRQITEVIERPNQEKIRTLRENKIYIY